MTSEEAQKMAAVALEADSGCSVCVRGQIHRLVTVFPEQQSMILNTWLADLDESERKGELEEMLSDLEEEGVVLR